MASLPPVRPKGGDIYLFSAGNDSKKKKKKVGIKYGYTEWLIGKLVVS